MGLFKQRANHFEGTVPCSAAAVNRVFKLSLKLTPQSILISPSMRRLPSFVVPSLPPRLPIPVIILGRQDQSRKVIASVETEILPMQEVVMTHIVARNPTLSDSMLGYLNVPLQARGPQTRDCPTAYQTPGRFPFASYMCHRLVVDIGSF